MAEEIPSFAMLMYRRGRKNARNGLSSLSLSLIVKQIAG